MAEYSDEELLFLSNLMHMRDEDICDENKNIIYPSPFEDIWTKKNSSIEISVGSIINKIDTAKLRQEPLRDYRFDGYISGYEWANMIDAMKNSKICELKLQNVNRDNLNGLSTYFKDKEGNAYVVFRGTGGGEWKDNFLGGTLSDTDQQKRALDYINSINADHITVVGHSKGGNKAKYVALLSDKVDRCVAFDGQGFSQFFIEKYQDLIEANKHKITCYALDEDFVNILLYDIYNEKHYIAGNGVKSFEENHSPNSFFHFNYVTEPRSNMRSFPFLPIGKLSGYEFVESKQAGYIADLHSFVNYVSSTISDKDREAFFSFLGDLGAMLLGKKGPKYEDGYTTDELLEFLARKENADQLGLLTAYILEYEEYNNGITDAIFTIMEGTKLAGLVKWLRMIEDKIGTENIIKFIIKNQKDIDSLLGLFKVPDNIRSILKNIAEGYNKKKYDVKAVTQKRTADYNMNANDSVRDYSQEKRDILLRLTDDVANEKPYDIGKWDIWYRFEDWFGLLNIDRYKNNINRYYEKVIDINGTSRKQMIQIFDEVDHVVRIYKNTMRGEIDKLNTISNKILSL